MRADMLCCCGKVARPLKARECLLRLMLVREGDAPEAEDWIEDDRSHFAVEGREHLLELIRLHVLRHVSKRYHA